MDISLDYINQVIARNNASREAGAKAASASSGVDQKLQASTGAFRPQDIAALQNQKKYWTTAMEDREQQRARQQSEWDRQQAYQQALDQHRQDMEHIRQRERLETATRSGNKDLQYRSVQEYLSGSEKARTLWDLEHGGNTNQNAAAQRKKDAEAVRASMSGAELSAYDAAMKVYDQYGGLYNAGRMVGDLVAGSLKNAAGNVMTTGQSAAKDYKNRAEALQQVYQQERSVNPLKAFAEVNSSYGQELDKTKEEVLDESSTGLQLAREGSEQLQRGAAGLNGGGKVAYDLASSMIANAPSMALALIPGVGPAASLGTLGAQAAGGKIDELSARGIENREALKRGVVSGVIESATEVLPVSNWVDIIKNGGKKAAINIAKQALGEATEEGASYVLNYIADKAFQDPEAEFSLQDLAASAAMGAASGGIYGAVGTGINRIGNKVASSTQQNGEKVAQVNQANKPADVLAVAQEDDMLNQLNTGGQAARNAAQAQQNTANAARAREAVDGTVQAENPLNQLFPGRKADQNAAQAQQNAVSAARAQEAVEGAVQAENPLNQLFPGGQAAQNAAQAQQNAVNDAQVQEAMAGNVQAETQLNQLFPGGQNAQNAADVQKNTMNAAQAQQEEVQQSAMRVRQWAEENESFTPEMRTLAEENYQPGGNTALYTTAMQNFYDAGRSGALSYEQAMELNQNRAAVLQQDSVLRRAWELGQKAANPVYDTPGGGRVEGQVQYESGAETNTVLDDTVLQAAAHKLGVNIKVVQELTDDAGGKANGRWAAAMSEIALGENSSNAYQTLAHEMTHYMGSYNPEGWQRLRSSALEWYAQQGGQRTGEDMARYEAAYGDYAKGADEAARDILSGVMSTEGGVRSFLAYLSTESGYTVQEQKTILQTLREMLDTLLEKVRGLLRGGDATVTAAQARQMAERADQLEARRALINDYLYELDNARQNAEQAGLQLSAKENAPAASRSEAEYSINPEFDREIREWDAEGRNESKIFTLGTTSEVLQSIGVRDRSIVMLSGKIQKILRDHPSMTMDMIRQIPAMLEHPALVLESQGGSMRPGTKQNSRIVVVGTVTDAQGNPVLCALDLAPSSRQDMELGLQDFNKVRSAYAKDVNPKGFLEKSNVLYASPDKKITQAALSSFSFKLASSELNHLGSIGRITYQGGKVNIQGVPFRQIFGEAGSDASYSRDVDSLEEAERLRRERDVWLDSEEVRQVRADYERERQMHGLFGGKLKEWKSNNPTWQAYEKKRKEYNQKIAELREKSQDAGGQRRAEAEQWEQERRERDQAAQKAYEEARAASGLTSEEYHRKQAAQKYKTTGDPTKAGYLMPDGTMLDFSDGQNRRVMDHREIQDIFGPVELGEGAPRERYMNQFIAEGNVRVMAEMPGVELSTETKPTRAQLDEIARMADTLGAQKGTFRIDLSRASGKQAEAREYQGRVRGREIVRDIEAYYRDGKLPEQSELNQYRYSRKAMELDTEQRRRRAADTENRRLARENSRMADQIELLKQETKLSGGHLVDSKSVHAVAARVVKSMNSRYRVSLLERELRAVYDSMSQGRVSNVQEAMEVLNDIARGVLSEQRPGVNIAKEIYRPLLDKVRQADWIVREGSPLYQDLLDLYGDGPNGKTWGNVRRALFGRIDIKKTSESGASGRIDALFEELAGDWPGIFDTEAAPADNIQRLMEVYDEVRNGAAYDLETGMSEEEQAAYLAQDLYDAYLSMPRRQTFADKSAAQAEALTRQYRQEKNKALEQQKAAYEKKLQEVWNYAPGIMKKLDVQNREILLRRQAALELQWSKKRERADVTQQRQRVQKSVQALHRWLMKPTAQQHVQTRMQGAVLNLLNSLDLKVGREGSGTAARWQEVMKDIQLMAKDALAADSGMADTDVYADFDPDLPAMIGELIQGNETLDVSRMNSRQLKQLADVLTSMQTSIRNANKMMSDAQGRTVDAIAEESAREMAAQTKTLLKNRYMWAGKVAQTRLGDAAGQLLGLDMMDARRYFTSLGTTAQEKIYGPIRKGFDKRVWLLDSAQKAFEEIKGDTDIRNWTGDRAPVEEIKLHDGRTIRLTVGQRMELYNLSQRQQAHEHLMQGGFTLVDSRGEKTGRRVSITAEDLAKITGSLTSEQVRMAQRMSDYLSAKDGPAGWGNEVSQKLYGLDKFTERHYWPIKSDSNQTRTSDATDGGTAGFWAIKNQGFTKNLQRNANNSVLVGDAFDTWANHVANMATYNAWSIPLSDAMKWFNWKSGTDVSTKEQIEGIYGRKGKSYFTTLLQDINGMSASPSSTGLDKLTREVTRNWKVAKVSANLRVAIQQPTAYIRAGAVMDPKYLAQALAADVTKLRHGMQMAEEHCAIAKWKSWGYFETNIGQSMRNVLTGQQSTMEKVREAGTKLAEMGDKVTWGTLWNACEAEAKARGLEAGTKPFNDYCADRLSEIVDKTQVVDSVLHRSHIMRSKNPLAQMSTNFFAEPTKSYSMMAEAWMDMMHGKEGAKRNFARATATYVLAALGTAAAASLIDAMRVSQDEDRDKEYGERYLQSLWENFGSGVKLLNNIPLVKDVLSIADGYDATRSDMEMFSELLEAFDAIQKARSGNITPYRLTYQVATALSSATGLPMSSAVREAKSAYDMLTDLQDPLQIDRKMNREEDDYSYIDLYNQVKATGGNKDEFKALYQGETYGDMLGTARAETVDTWLQTLARNSGKDGEENTAVLPKQLGNELTYTDAQGVEHKVVMKGPEYVEYAKSVQQSTVNLIDEYIKTAGKTASTDEQAYFVKLAKEYAQETARETLIPGYEAKDWVITVKTLSRGQNVGSMILARQIVSRTEGEKDSDGKTISGSKAANAVQRLQQELGYSAGEAQALYNNLSGATDNTYMKLYQAVEGDKRQVDQLAALFGTGEAASYAGMLQKSSAGKVDAWLQELSGSQGKEVLPDRVQPSFKAGDEEVELDGKQYIEYANSRTQTAYNILNELVPYVGNYSEEEQAGFVTNVETYATQVAKAEVSGFEPYQWVKDVQEQAGDDSQALFMYIMAKELIYSAEGQKDADGKTISGTKKAAALKSLQEAGYSAAMAQQMYKLFG